MGRRSAEKSKVIHRKGLWSPEEDQRLRSYVLKHGHGCWTTVPIKSGLQRNGKSCRLRWINYLRPGLKRGMFSAEEEEIILTLHSALGNKWSQISQHLPGRTDNEIKNHWHSHLKKKLANSKEMETSSSEVKNSSLSSKNNLETQIPNYTNSFQKIENSSPRENDIVEKLVPQGSTFPNRSHLPKLLFSAWLSSSDPVNHSGSFTDSKVNVDFHHNSNLQDCLLNYEEMGCKFHNELISSNSSLDDIMFSSQFQFEDQILGSGNGSGNDFFMNNDVINI